MSGFAVGYGNPDQASLDDMMKRMAHRGPHLCGTGRAGRVMMAQNVCRADAKGNVSKEILPVQDPTEPERMICYDGQMGNLDQLARDAGVGDVVFPEEETALRLYRRQGADFLKLLDDTIFALVIADGRDFLAARDLLGIKTLFYGHKGDTTYFASELKALAPITDEIYEFPAGHYMDSSLVPKPFAELPKSPPPPREEGVDQMVAHVRQLVRESVRGCVDFRVPTASLLSGGMDSSAIAYESNLWLREHFGANQTLKTFAIGLGEGGEGSDIQNARLMADFMGTDHHELIVDLDELFEALPEVIYALESFDPSLVRSSVSNFLISRYAARQGIELLLSGEGGDEVFCGYLYLKDYPPEQLFEEQMRCLGFLHNNASLRLDRMNQCNSVKVVAPLISGRLLQYAMQVPPEYKLHPNGDTKVEKWIFRKAYEGDLPEAITSRLKQEFSQGSGVADLLPARCEKEITDAELAAAQEKFPMVRSKEELYYFRLFVDRFGDGAAVNTVGQWVLL